MSDPPNTSHVEVTYETVGGGADCGPLYGNVQPPDYPSLASAASTDDSPPAPAAPYRSSSLKLGPDSRRPLPQTQVKKFSFFKKKCTEEAIYANTEDAYLRYQFHLMFRSSSGPLLPNKLLEMLTYGYDVVHQSVFYLLSMVLAPFIVFTFGIVAGLLSFIFVWVSSPALRIVEGVLLKSGQLLRLVVDLFIIPVCEAVSMCFSRIVITHKGTRYSYDTVNVTNA